MDNLKIMKIIQGGKHTDHRGTLSYFKDFNLDEIKRMYIIEHPDINVVRAWQGHKMEQKWFKVITGQFKLVIVKVDDWLKPSAELPHDEYILDEKMNQILHITGGFVSGFQAIQPNSKMIIFSNFTVEESIKDDYRFEKDLWYNW